MVFTARHLAGIRAPTFALAGMHGMPLRTFLLWDLAGGCVSVPITVVLGYFFSEHLDLVSRGMARVEHWAVAIAVTALCVYLVVVWLLRWRARSAAGALAEEHADQP